MTTSLSLLEQIHPLLALRPLAGLGTMAACWMIAHGVWLTLSARRSPGSGAWAATSGLLASLFLLRTLKPPTDSPWLLLALLGTWLLLWVLLTPLYLRWRGWLAPLLWVVAVATVLFDAAQLLAWGGTLLVSAKGQPPSPWMSTALSMWQILALAALLFGLARYGALTSAWLRQLGLSYFGITMILTGISGFDGRATPNVTQAPMLYLTALAAGLLATQLVPGGPATHEWIERYRAHAGTSATHLFLILFTVATMYPVLWVVRMALTPTQSFTLDVNPMPRPLVHYFQAWRKGDKLAARCYRRAMVQNFREVMGQGSACYDQLCHQWRQLHDRDILRRSDAICKPFAAIWKLAPQQSPPANLANKPDELRIWREKALEQTRKQALQRWQAGVLATIQPATRRPKIKKLLKEIAFQQRERIEQGSLFWRQTLNSILVALATTLLGLFLATTAAYSFSRFRFPGRRVGLMSFLVSQMFPGTLMMIPLYILISRLGLLDSLVGLTLVYSTTSIPFCVWMLKGYFDTIPKELEEAALIDGASRTLIFWKIMLPLARPAIAVTALFSFMTAWNEFILAVTFMNDKRSFTLPVMLQQFVGSHNTEWGHFAAGAILVSLPIVLLFFVLQKHLVSGLTAGSVKG